MHDPLGILGNDQDSTTVDPLGILPQKKSKVGTQPSQNGGQVGTSVPQSVRDDEDQVGAVLQPHVEKLKIASGNFYNQPQAGEQYGHAPLLTNISDIKEQQKPIVTPKQEKDVAEKNLITVSDLVKKTAFQNGNQAKDYIKKKTEKYGGLDLNNQTNQLAKERSDEFDKIKNDVYGEDGTGSIAAAALKEKMESDPNFHQKFINMYKEGIGLPQEEEGNLIADYTARHQGDLEELSKENQDIKTDYEDVTKNLINRLPDYGKQLVAQKITNEREKRNLNSAMGNFSTATASKHNDQIANDILSPEEQKIWQDNRKEIEGNIVKGGFLNNLANIKDLPKHTQEAIEGYAGLDKSGGEAAYNEMQGKVADPSKGWKQVAGTLGDLTGKLIYMAAISKGLGTAGVPAEAASKLSVPATFGKEILDETRSEFPEDDTKAKVSAFLKTGLLTFLNPLHADKASEAVNDILSKATDSESAATLRSKLIKGILGTGKEVSTAAAQNLTYTAAAQVVDKALGMDEEAFRKFHPEGEAAESVKQGAIMGVIPGVLKGASEISKSAPTETPPPKEELKNETIVKKEQPTPIEKEEKPTEVKPEDKIVSLAKENKLGAYSKMVEDNPSLAGDVMLDYAKQKYGLKDDGTDIEGGGRDIGAADEAVTQKFPSKQSVIDAIKPPDNTETIPAATDEGGNKVGVSHASLTDLAKKLGLKEPEHGEYQDPSMYASRGRRLLEGGADPNEVNNTNNDLHDRISIARAHLEDLVSNADKVAKEHGIDSEEYKAAIKETDDYANNTVKKLGTAAHQAMVSLQGERDVDTDSFTQVKRKFQETTGNPPSKEQESKIKDLTDTNVKLKEQADQAEAKLIEETEKAFKAGVEEGKKTKTSDKAKNVANKLRESAKLHKPGSFSAATPASLVWDTAVEVVAKGIEAGGKIADVIEDGLKHIRESDWYKSLNEDKKQNAEKEFKQFGFDNAPSNSVEDLQARFVGKKGNKFTPNEAKDIWSYAKNEYLDNGVSYREMISKVSNDLGLSWRQVSEAIATPKTQRISNEMWKKQADYRKNQNATKRYVEAQSGTTNPLLKGLKKVSAAVRGVSVYGHGGIFIGTHAGMTLFNPSQYKSVIPAFIRGWKFAYGNEGKYERRIEQLKNEPNYVLAQRAGLKNNPDVVNAEEYQKSQEIFKKLGGNAGIKGFNAIKVLRQDLFDSHYNKLSDAEKADPKSAQMVARLVNLATGATNLKLPDWVNEVSFAGGMESARWGKLTRNPAKATQVAVKALFGKGTTADKVFAKVWARRVGEQLGTFTGLLLANAAIQNTLYPNNKTNYTNPDKPDFLKFKFGNLTLDPTSGMRSALMFAYGIGKIPFMTKKERRGDAPVKSAGKSVAGYARGKLAPAYGVMADFFDKSDFNQNPMPYSDEKVPAGKHKLSWGEYAWEHAPLPIAHAAQDMYHSALDNGADKLTLNHVLNGLVSGAISGGTGLRVGEYNAEHERPSAFTNEDKKDPTFKYFIDKGMELPNTVNSSEIVTDEKTKTKTTVSDFPPEKQKEYRDAHKEFLKEELDDYKKHGYVYTKRYKTSNGTQLEVYKGHTKGATKTKIDDLDKEGLAQILSDAQSSATKKAKEKVFKKH